MLMSDWSSDVCSSDLAIWGSANLDDVAADAAGEGDAAEAVARARLARMTPRSRQALLLTAMDGFTPEDTAYLVDVEADEVEQLVGEEQIGRASCRERVWQSV